MRTVESSIGCGDGKRRDKAHLLGLGHGIPRLEALCRDTHLRPARDEGLGGGPLLLIEGWVWMSKEDKDPACRGEKVIKSSLGEGWQPQGTCQRGAAAAALR